MHIFRENKRQRVSVTRSHAPGLESRTLPPRSPVLFPGEEGGGGSWKAVVPPNASHGATWGKVQTCCNITEKLMLPKISSQHPSRPSPQVAAARGNASLLPSPSTLGSSYWESPWLGLNAVDPWQSATQWRLVQSLRHGQNILMLAAGKVKEFSVRGGEMMGRRQQHPLANPPVREKRKRFATAKGW